MSHHIPVALTPLIFRAIAESGDRSEITRVERAKGGYESYSWRIGTRRRSYLLKYHLQPGVMDYVRESRDLELLRDAGLRVPNVIVAEAAHDEIPDYCVQEWILPGTPQMHSRRLGRPLGEAIARLHMLEQNVPGYGRECECESEWVEQFRKRVLRIARTGADSGRLSAERAAQAQKVAARLDDLLGGVERRPSLLHGDLHANNVLANRHGESVLIDPHAFYGDREEEIAYTQLYGHFALTFYDGYRSVYSLDDGYQNRKDIYCLYHLLVRVVEGGMQLLP